MRLPSMAISPLSGMRNPATRLSSVVLPQPDGPSSVINSPRRTVSDTSLSAVMLPKRFVTPSSSTAVWSRTIFGLPGTATGNVSSAGLLNVEDLCKAKEDIGQCQQRCGDDNVYDRDRSHRRVGVFADVVVEGNGQRLRALRSD